MHHNSIAIDQLSYCYPDGTQALQDISLQIHAGERVALIGANGSGKSTFLQHLNGILMPQTGAIEVGEYPMQAQYLKQIRNFVGLVFQNPDDQLFMPTVWEDVSFGPLNQAMVREEIIRRCHHAMYAVGLDPLHYGHRNTSNLSGGEKKRVAIAGVLAMQPQILALDEPSAQLDPRSRRQFIHLLQSLPITQLIATHDLDLALELCDRTLVLSQGHLVYDGATVDVLFNAEFLYQHGLEPPLSYSRPYCHRGDRPDASRSDFNYSSFHPSNEFTKTNHEVRSNA
ncbi:MAG: energy-coupling factor ABC transporter ATP-binding protein [Synechococcales bacterium]|nr:energy-coupling factor ABC transporter ATP-binding protein [Synechococcales bacterium]